MSVRLAVVDLIGTTIHAGDEVVRAFREAFRSVAIDVSDEEIENVRGRSKSEAVVALLLRRETLAPEVGPLAERVITRFHEEIRAAYRDSARAIHGARAALDRLTRAGVPIVLTTGLDRETTRLLIESVGWSDLDVRAVVTGDDVSRGRPAPDLIHAAMRAVGIDDASTVLAVGDTVSDLEAAANANVGWSVGVTSGAHARSRLEACPHAVILESIRELPDWLRARGLLRESGDEIGPSVDEV
jgi:phosphonatase-like hydrolase